MLRLGLSLTLGHALNSCADVFNVSANLSHADSLRLDHAFHTAHSIRDAVNVSGVTFDV